MRKIEKKLFKNLIFIVVMIATFSLVSCTKILLGVKVDGLRQVSTKSDVNADNKDISEHEQKKEIGDKLVELTGDVFTLSHYKLPQVGSNLYGFKVNAIYDYESRNAKLVLFEHEKSGAKLVLISNDDEDKSAVFAFNTLTYDNKGIPHVFEHACLGGSEKYPNANLFMEATSKTYNTFMNAFTMQNATIYPFSSLSDSQLYELYKFYFDGVMQPNVIKDKKGLEREAYRYILNDKNDDIALSGIVYSEMSGVEGNISNVAYRNSLRTMFNDSYMGMNTGGATSDIPDITLEDLISFHEKYYHPSNMAIVLYGDIDYEKYLKYADDEYLSKCDKRTIEKEDPDYKEQREFNQVSYDFPVSEDDETEGGTIIDYSIVCDGMTQYESGLFNLVINALNDSDGPIKNRLVEKYPDVDFLVESCLYFPRPFILIRFTNVNEDYAENLKTIVEESFAEIIKDGINQDVLDKVLDYIEYSLETSKDSHGFAYNCETELTRMFSSNKVDASGLLGYEKGVIEIGEAYKSGKIKELIEKYLGDNNHSSMCITVPKKGLLEEKIKNQKDKLLKMKEDLTDDEINEFINATKEFDAWVEEQGSYSLVHMIRNATLSELDEYRAKCYAYEENIEGVNFIRSEVDDLKYNSFGLYLDLSGFTIEEVMKLKLLSSLILDLPTKNYQGQKMKSAFSRYILNYSEGVSVNRYYNGGYKPYYMFYATTLDKNLDKSFELLKEHMYETTFDDIEKLKSTVSLSLNNYKYEVNYRPTSAVSQYLDVKTDNDAIYDYNISGIKYMNFLKQVSEMNDDDLANLLKEMEQLYKDIRNANGMVCQVIGNFNTIKDIKTRIINMSYGFDHQRIVSKINIATESDMPDKIAIVVNGTMLYNYMITPMLKDGIDFSAKYAVLSSIIDAKVLYPEFRVKRSAYGSYSSFSRLNSFVYTYRDPNLKESYEVFNDLPNLMSKVKLADDELDDFKLNAYASFSYPLTKYGAADIAVSETFAKVNDKRPDRYVRYMKEIKEMTKEDVDDLNVIFDKMVNDGIYITVGSKEKIEENADMFDEIIYDYVK